MARREPEAANSRELRIVHGKDRDGMTRDSKAAKDRKASCPLGYTEEDLERYFGAKKGEPHPLWTQLEGQTGAICEGRRFNHETREYEPTECADHPHGYISYVSDVEEWVRGEKVSDW